MLRVFHSCPPRARRVSSRRTGVRIACNIKRSTTRRCCGQHLQAITCSESPWAFRGSEFKMTEVTDAPKSGYPESAADLVHTRDWFAAPDHRLQWMADTADSVEVGIGITLVVPGGVISGSIISGQKFFKDTAEAFRVVASDD